MLQAQLKFKTGFHPGPTANSVDIVIQPNVNFTGYLTNVIFILQIPAGVTQPTIARTSLTPYFPTFNTLTTLPNEGGYTTYGFSAINVSNTANTVVNAGTMYSVLRLTFSGGPVAPTDIRLSHLIDGGPGTLYQNYVEANAVGPGAGDYTDYVQMFFGGLVIPSSPAPDEGTGYSTYQYSQIAQLLPVNWLSFNTNKQGNDALVNWTVGNEDGASYYELQRSINGNDFNTIAKISKANTYGRYDYTDAAITNLGDKTLYYRIKQVDINGRISYSDIRLLRLDLRDTEINIYPNPAVKGFYVSVPLINPGNKKVKLTLVAPDGKIAAVKEITAAMASNYYFDIKDNTLAAGQYNLQIIYEENVLANKKIFINQ